MVSLKIFGRYEKIKPLYYFKSGGLLFYPKALCRKRLRTILNSPLAESEEVALRVNYYNKLTSLFSLANQSDSVQLRNFRLKNYKSAYFFDTFEYVRFFDPNLWIRPLFGDITFVPEVPSLVKSRPIGNDNANSVLLNLDKFRHFNFIRDTIEYEDKIDKLVWRGHISLQKQNRIDFLQKFWNHPLCDVGYTNSWNGNPLWKKGWLTMAQHLRYKFILCLEGVDVATNLKWVMSSNSVAVSTKPRYETWFMEGTLIPDFHYIQIADDFSDLEDKLLFYMKHPTKVKEIIRNAQSYTHKFTNRKVEQLIALKVLDKYFGLQNKMFG